MNAPAFPASFNAEPQLKEAFAESLYAGSSAFIAALRLWPHETQRSLAYSKSVEWLNDPYVVAHIAKLKAKADLEAKGPDKEQFLKMLRDRMPGMEDDDFIKASRLYAEAAGFIEKPAPAVVNNLNNTNFERVMVVKDHGTNDDWEAKAKAQQAKLVNG